ncbi:hypothetical protein D3C86_1645390 [compost metagenome]
MFRYVFAQFRHQIVPVQIFNRRPPAEVVQAVVAHAHLFAIFQANNLRHPSFNADGHIADVEDFGLRTQTARRFSDDRRRVGVVEHPRVRGVFLHVIHQLQHAANGAHAVGDPARSAGFLAQYAVTQWDFFIFFAHRVFADADMRHHKVHVGKGRFRVGGVAEVDVRSLLLKDDFARLGDGFLTCAVIVIELESAQREAIAIRQ